MRPSVVLPDRRRAQSRLGTAATHVSAGPRSAALLLLVGAAVAAAAALVRLLVAGSARTAPELARELLGFMDAAPAT